MESDLGTGDWSVWAWLSEDEFPIYLGKQFQAQAMHRKRRNEAIGRPPRERRVILKKFISEKACVKWLEQKVHDTKMLSLEKYGEDRNLNSDWTNYKSLLRETTTLGVTDKRGTKVYVYKLDGEFVGEFDSVSMCARRLGVNRGNIFSALAGRINQTGGYTFRRKKLNK